VIRWKPIDPRGESKKFNIARGESKEKNYKRRKTKFAHITEGYQPIYPKKNDN
jgi:hypothetical protein